MNPWLREKRRVDPRVMFPAFERALGLAPARKSPARKSAARRARAAAHGKSPARQGSMTRTKM